MVPDLENWMPFMLPSRWSEEGSQSGDTVNISRASAWFKHNFAKSGRHQQPDLCMFGHGIARRWRSPIQVRIKGAESADRRSLESVGLRFRGVKNDERL